MEETFFFAAAELLNFDFWILDRRNAPWGPFQVFVYGRITATVCWNCEDQKNKEPKGKRLPTIIPKVFFVFFYFVFCWIWMNAVEIWRLKKRKIFSVQLARSVSRIDVFHQSRFVHLNQFDHFGAIPTHTAQFLLNKKLIVGSNQRQKVATERWRWTRVIADRLSHSAPRIVRCQWSIDSKHAVPG